MLEEAQANVKGNNPYGAVKSGFVHFRGVLKRGCVLKGKFPQNRNLFDMHTPNLGQY